MTYPESVRLLYSLGNEVKTAKLGLDRIQYLLDALGAPHRGGRFVHVAGTNGKGSTCAMIESGLRAAGLRTGLTPRLTWSSRPSGFGSAAFPSRRNSSPGRAKRFTRLANGCSPPASWSTTRPTSRPSPRWLSCFSGSFEWTSRS